MRRGKWRWVTCGQWQEGAQGPHQGKVITVCFLVDVFHSNKKALERERSEHPLAVASLGSGGCRALSRGGGAAEHGVGGGCWGVRV